MLTKSLPFVICRQCGSGSRGNGSSKVKPTNANITAPITLGFDPKPRLFAVIVAINNYEAKDFPDLYGAVADATDVVDLLLTDYHVPRDQIRFLTNNFASRSGIISALNGLSLDPRIQPEDPILFYFAGHGSEITPPKGWECGGQGSKIQVLVPQDYCSRPGLEIPGIPDRTIGFLLDKIAHNKGDNITVILDCCHSASGTRGDSIRSVNLDSSIHTNALDMNIRDECVPQTGLASHVLLSACRPSEVAREDSGRGAFTTELLQVLRAIPPNKLRYRDILYKMGPIASQNPQCEGLHQDRYLFDAKIVSPAPPSYVPRHDPGFNAVVVNAGTAHDVTDGAEFAICVAQEPNPHGKPLGIYVVNRATPFYSIMKPAGGLSISTSPLPSGLVAFQTKPGPGSPLRLYVPSHRDLIMRACGDDLHHVQFVKSSDEARLELAVQGNQVAITVRDTQATQQGHYQLAPTSVTRDKLSLFLQEAQASFRKRDHCSIDTDLIKDIAVEFYKLEDTPSFFEDISEPELWPSSSNLYHDGMIDLVIEDGCAYGVKLTNNGPYNLYPSLFYFNSSDLTRIRTYYQPPSSGPYLLEPPLKSGGTLTIGYGSGGMPPFSYSLSGEINVGFLKLYVSTRPLNSSSATGPCLCSSGAQHAGRALRETWGTITIPMIQRPSPSRNRAFPNGRRKPVGPTAFTLNLGIVALKDFLRV